MKGTAAKRFTGDRGSIESPFGTYRWRLWRTRPGDMMDEHDRHVTFVMINPSTAGADLDDPTLRRCCHFAEREGAGLLRVVNLYALRSPKQAALLAHPDPVGPENDDHIDDVMATSDLVILGWGAGVAKAPNAEKRIARVLDIAAARHQDVTSLGVTKDGHPCHPLMLADDTPLTSWRDRDV
jgi:hypothetical protein